MAFQGSARFELVQKLGEGGMGVVYEAFDRERDMRVALKTLRNLDASSLYRFKREFRSLSDMSHPNIIGLYELVSEHDDWFFTMELVEGNDFISYLRPQGFDPAVLQAKAVSTAESPDTLDTRVLPDTPPGTDTEPDDDTTESSPISVPRAVFSKLVDERRLRRSFAQLAQALDTLHRAGMVHRDLKPSNIRVTPTERVVLMDFGIVAELTIRGSDDSSDAKAVGTPAYMAPEQAAGEPASAAADWYSFGVVLFLAMTGRLPFSGRRHKVMMDKQSRDAPRASTFTDGVPEDLDVLCADLLERRPVDRIRGYEVLARLGAVSADATAGIDATTVGGLTHFVGRETELQRLHAAYDEMRDRKTVATFVVGTSGMGKSTLVRRFLHEVEAKRAARDLPVVLRGRCHERESLPYKAFDTVVDNLSHFLMGLAEQRVASLLPDEVDLVTRLFPVLRRVPGIQTARPLGGLDPHELRVRAFGALREMLRRIADWRPLVLYIDDLQWADPDSLDLLLELTREPLPPRFLLVSAVRAENIMYEESRAEGVVQLMNEIAARHTCERITVGGLNDDEQRQLVERLLGGHATPQMLELRYWRDSAGSPFFLGELVRHAQESAGPEQESAPPRLEEVLLRRVERVPDEARTLLEATAVAGEPMALSALARAIDVNPVEAERASAILRVGNLARVAKHGQDPWLTAYHDRVRETVTDNLSEERRRELHQRIAQALERAGDASVDALARHWLAAGDPHQARSYLVTAAENAQAKLAFGRAADLYQAALDVSTDPAERRTLLRAMADSLATAGRYFEAAGAYERAAEDAGKNEAVDLTRLAADNLLRSGRIIEGLDALQKVINDLGLRIPATRRRALAALVLQRARIVLRGYKFTARAESEIPARQLGRLDTLYAASTCIGMIDHIRGAAVQTRHLVQTLKFGEERRVCRALAIEAVFRSSFGGRNLRKAEKLRREVELMARRIGDPYLIGVAHLAQAAVTFFGEKLRLAANAFAEAERIFSQECVGADWERLTAAYFYCTTKILLGEIADMTRYAGRFIEEAERRRNRYAQTLFRSYPSVWILLAEDKPEEALDKVEMALEGWPTDVYYMSHNFVTINRAATLIYMGRQDESLQLLEERWRPLHQSMIARIPMLRAEFGIYLGYSAVVHDDGAAMQRAFKAFDKYRTAAGRGLVTGVRACVAARKGDQDRAQELLLEALQGFDQAEFKMYAAAYRYRLGELTGGSEGERLRQDAREHMIKEGVVNPERLIGMYAPQFIIP